MNAVTNNKSNRRWRDVLFEIIFEADTPAGKWFDIVLIICILLSVITIMLDSVSSIRAKHGELLYAVEWFFTILFTVEYILGCSVSESRFGMRSAFSESLICWRYFPRI